MKIYFDLRDIDFATLPASLRPQIEALVRHATENGLLDLTVIVIVDAPDTSDDLVAAIGWSPLTNPIDGAHYDDPCFEPPWASITSKDGWTCIVQPVSNDGFAYFLYVHEAGNGDIQAMCRTFVQ